MPGDESSERDAVDPSRRTWLAAERTWLAAWRTGVGAVALSGRLVHQIKPIAIVDARRISLSWDKAAPGVGDADANGFHADAGRERDRRTRGCAGMQDGVADDLGHQQDEGLEVGPAEPQLLGDVCHRGAGDARRLDVPLQ